MEPRDQNFESGFRVQGLELRVKVQSLTFKVRDSGFKVQG
jgi:hypothetical protein